MIRVTKLNYVGIVVRDLKRSLAWYRKHFGFKKLFSVDNGLQPINLHPVGCC